MSNIFNLSNILKESSISEIPTAVSENYMITAIKELNEFNEYFTESSKRLYSSICEAETKEAENSIFASYFDDMVTRTNSLIKNINEVTSRFVVNIDNIVDTNKDILNNPTLFTDCNNFAFTKYTFKNINDPKIPKIAPVSHYKKEFDIIGQMLQELGPVASNQAKLKVIATVYNNMSSTIKNDWVASCMEEVVGRRIPEESDFATELYANFRDKDPVDTTINKSMLYKIKVSMEDYKTLVEAITESADKLIADMQYIVNDFCTMITGSKDGKIVIDTPTDGIRNTSYKSDTYISNQLNIFLKSKVDQIVRMFNVYYIALSIKLDAATDYFNQCKEIINMAAMNTDNPVANSKVDNTEDQNKTDWEKEFIGDDDDDDEDTDDEDTDDEPSEPEDDENKEPIREEEPDDKSDVNKELESEEELSSDNPTNENCQQIKDMIRSFNYQVYEISLESYTLDIYQHAQSFINEADGGAGQGAWKRIVNKLAEVFNKFKTNATNLIQDTSDKSKIQFIKNNEKVIFDNKVIPHKNPDGSKVAPKIDFGGFNKVRELPDTNLEDAAKYQSTEAIAPIFLKGINIKQGESISETIKKLIIDEDNGYKDTAEMEPVKEVYYKYVTDMFKDQVDEINDFTKIIERAKASAERNNLTESVSLLGDAEEYFMEFSATGETKPGGEGNAKSGTGNNNLASANDKDQKSDYNTIQKYLTAYFTCASTVLTTLMSTAMTVFNECYSFLSWHIKMTKGTTPANDTKKEEQKKETKTEEPQKDVKFNN